MRRAPPLPPAGTTWSWSGHSAGVRAHSAGVLRTLLAQCAAVIDTLDDLDGSLIDKVLQRQAE